MVKQLRNAPKFIDEYTPGEPKKAGRKSPGPLGGKYKYGLPGDEHGVMMKRETYKGVAQPHKVIAEFLGAKIVGTINPNGSPQTYFVSSIERVIDEENPENTFYPTEVIPDKTGDDVYLASVYYENYKSFSKYALNRDDENRAVGQETVGFSKSRLRKNLYVKNTDANGNEYYDKSRFKGYDEAIIASVLINDFDVISTNIGARPFAADKKELEAKIKPGLISRLFAKLRGKPAPRDATKTIERKSLLITDDTHTVRLDFGEGMGNLEDEIHIHSHTRHPFGFGPTNHVREIPRSVKISQHFADAIRDSFTDEKIEKLHATIDKAVKSIGEFYDVKPIQAYAKHAGFVEAEKITDKKHLLIQLKGFLNAKMENRIRSFKRLEMEIRMSLCFKRLPGLIPRFEINHNELKRLLLESQERAYFSRGDFHFRKKDQRFNLGVFKYRFNTLQTLMNGFIQGHMSEIERAAIAQGQVDILEGLQLNKKIKHAHTKSDYHDAAKLSAARLMKKYEGDARRIRNHIIEEILLEKSLEHRSKIIDRYLYLHGALGVAPAITIAVRAALNNDNVKRLDKTKQVSQYLDQFYRKQRHVRITAKNHAPNPRVSGGQKTKSKSSITFVMQSKWLQLSLNCEAPPLLAKNKSALFARKVRKRKIEVVPVLSKKMRTK